MSRISSRTRALTGKKKRVPGQRWNAHSDGDAEYRPLVDVRGLPCWPAGPLYEQLVEGETQEREGWDFESFWDRRRVGRRSLNNRDRRRFGR